MQYELVQLGAGYRNICVVGDPDQSIYSWRSADLRNILNFEKDYPEAKVVLLEQNYRSTQTILDAAERDITKTGAARGEAATEWSGCRWSSGNLHEAEEARFVVAGCSG